MSATRHASWSETEAAIIAAKEAVLDAAKKYADAVASSGVHYSGKVETVEDLPENASNGDMYHVSANSHQYVWNTTTQTWDDYGNIFSLSIDPSPTSGSPNPVSSGGVFAALAAKQASLTFDTAPTHGSTNPVTSAGIFAALSGKVGTTALSSHVAFDLSTADGMADAIQAIITILGGTVE